MVMGCNCLSAYSNPRSLICALRSVPDASNTLAAARLQSRALDPRCWRHGLARTRPIARMRMFFDNHLEGSSIERYSKIV
jgi:hypothetical protein